MKKILPPLSYPGAKTFALDKIVPHFPSDMKRMVSPFFGGGSVELEMVARGVEVYGYDLFEPLVCFYRGLREDAHAVATLASSYYPMDREKYFELRNNGYWKLEDDLERAAAFFVLNKASFGGLAFASGGFSKCNRFTLDYCEKLKRWNKANTAPVELMSFEKSLVKHADDFAYVDPPYLLNGDGNARLYGVQTNQVQARQTPELHKDFDHQLLADILCSRGRWILSYNDVPEVRELYDGYEITTPRWTYSTMTGDMNSREVLVFSNDISPRVVELF